MQLLFCDFLLLHLDFTWEMQQIDVVSKVFITLLKNLEKRLEMFYFMAGWFP